MTDLNDKDGVQLICTSSCFSGEVLFVLAGFWVWLRMSGGVNGMADRKDEIAYGVETVSVHGRVAERQTQAGYSLTTPIVQTATYTFTDSADLVAYKEDKLRGGPQIRNEYARYGNLTLRAVEARIAALEGGEAAMLCSCGMAAITTTLLTVLPTGSHVVFTNDCYNKTRQFCEEFLSRMGIESSEVPMGDYAALAAAIRPNTRMIISESPTNPYLRVADLEQVVAIAKQQPDVKTIIDATFATPINIRPLEYGIDYVVHSATKYIGGHNDVLAGVVISSAELIDDLRTTQGMLGGVLDPTAAAKVERGLKTLALRVQHQNDVTQQIAEFLQDHPAVEQVWYPGLTSHPDYAVAARQMSGFGGVVSFEVKAISGENVLDTASRVVDALEIPYLAPSLGGIETLVMQPSIVSFFQMTTEERLEVGIKDSLIRLSVGLESVDDLIADLQRALDLVAQ